MILVSSIKDALGLLASLPERKHGAVSIQFVEDQHVWLGMGYCVAKGYAVYRGGYEFKMTPKGRKFLAEEADENR